jgi:hypothetical protein
MKDLLLDANGLILIDRETSKPWRAFFRRGWCVKAIRRSLYRWRLANRERPDIPEAYAAAIAPVGRRSAGLWPAKVREHTESKA